MAKPDGIKIEVKLDKCRNCPFVDKCDRKRMESHCYRDEPIGIEAGKEVGMNAAQPVLRETMQMNIGGVMTTVYKDEIEKELYKAFREPFSLDYGA